MNYDEENQANSSEPIGYDIFAETAPDVREAGSYDLFNVEPSRSSDDRLKRLEKSKSSALERLNSGASLDDSFTDMGGGWLESNKNKMWNDLSDQEIQSLYQNVMNKALTTDEQGRTFYSDGTEYTGTTRRAYLGGTKDNTSDAVKFGLARSDRPDSAARYDPTQGGYVSGEKGIDTNKIEQDVLLPYGVATMMEAVLHGRKKALEGRVVKDMFANPNAKASYGGGASEYYTSRDALFGAPTDTDTELGTKLFDEYMAKMPFSHTEYRGGKGGLGYLLGDQDDRNMDSPEILATKEAVRKYQAEKAARSPILSELKQTVSALPAGVAKGAIDLVDAAQEAITFLPQLAVRMATGDGNYDIDLFDDGLKESIVESVDSAVGYNRSLDTATMEAAYNEIKAAGVDVTSLDSIIEAFTNPEKRSRLGSAALTFLSDPSLTASMVTEIFGSGLGLGAATKVGSKVAPKLFETFKSNSSKIKTALAEAVKAGDKAEIQKLSESYTLGKKVGDLLKGSVFTNADMAVRMNNDITAFKENNNGESPDNAKLFEMAVLNRIVSSAEVMSLKSLAGIKNAPADVVKKAAKDGVVRSTGKVMGNMLKGGVTEGMQETMDSIVEQLNQKLGSADWEGKTASEVLSESSADILTGTIAGTASGVHIPAVSSVKPLISKALGSSPSNESEYVPESDSAVRDTENLSNDYKTFASDNEASNPIASFYAAQASNDNGTKAKASSYAANARETILDGSNSIFHSDKPVSLSDLSRVVEIAAASNPEDDYTPLKTAIERSLKNKGDITETEITETVDSAYKAGKAFARAKTMAEVSNEVSTGIGGFVTYYSAAKAAENVGDIKSQAENVKKLESFYHYEKEKAARIESKLEEVEGLVTAEAEALIRSGKASDMNEALRLKGRDYGKHSSKSKGKTTTVKNSSKVGAKTTEIPHYDVALKLRTQESSQPFKGGIYNLLSKVNSEVSSMGDVYEALGGEVATKVVPVDKKPEPTIEEAVDTSLPASKEVPTELRTEKGKKASKVSSEVLEAQKAVDDLNVAIAESEGERAASAAEDLELSDSDISEALNTLADTDFDSTFNNEDVQEDFDSSFIGTDSSFVDGGPADSTFVEDSESETAEEKIVETGKPFTKKDPRKTESKLPEVDSFQSAKQSLNDINKKIQERKDYLRSTGIITDELTIPDNELDNLLAEKESIVSELGSFESTVEKHIDERSKAFGNKVNNKFVMFQNYSEGSRVDEKYNIKDIFGDVTPTGFTITEQKYEDLHKETQDYGKRLEKVVPKENPTYLNGVSKSIAGFLLYDTDGNINYNTVQAMHAATNDYLLRNAENLFGSYRNDEDIAKILGIDETSVTDDDRSMLIFGGVTLRLASADIGKSIVRNLGIKPSTVAAQNALETHLGIAALQGYADKDGQGVKNEVLSRARKGKNPTNINIVSGTDKLLDRLGSISDTNKSIEERLDVKVTNEKSYRKVKKSKPRKVKQHNAEHLNAPKDHTSTVNKMENTGFSFNSGNAVLLDLFSSDGALDKEALMDKIIGSSDQRRNKDDSDSYKAQRAALKRSLDAYTDAQEDVGTAELFFNWFIAKNHRMHLDSTGINPQSDKHIARWLITATNASVDINKDLLEEVVEGKHEGNFSDDVMKTKTFAYAIVQAFDGIDGIPGVDKDPEHVILDSAKKLLNGTYSVPDMYDMARSPKLAHVGHAALAIANIQKFQESNPKATFNSDMVLEVDGLTNGFAFRAMQYPVGSEYYDVKEWLEKVGVIEVDNSNVGSKSNKPLSELKSMNSAREAGQEDVYISTGKVLGTHIKEAKSDLESTSSKTEEEVAKDQQSTKWVNLFEKHGKLPDFTADMTDGSDKAKDLLKFVRNLMKSPVMIFGYAAGIDKIVGGLVNDQIMGRGYLKGKGLVAYLTDVDDKGEYLITEADLEGLFPEEGKGTAYHQARVDLDSESLLSNTNEDIVTLRKDLEAAISSLYGEPLKRTLTELFSEQTEINASLVQAGEFLFKHFNEAYKDHVMRNPTIDEKGKMEWLKNYADIIPGISGASSTDHSTKLAFLKNVLDETNNYVIANMDGKKLATNTVSRGYGDPGVGPAVLTILSLDSSNLAIAINEFYKDMETADVVPVHDAIVLGVGDFGLVKKYSKVFYLLNKRYSIVEEISKAINALESRLGDDVNKLTIEGLKGDVTFKEMKGSLDNSLRKVQAGRSELYSKKLNVGQMVLSDGTMYIADPDKDKDVAVEYIKDLAGRIDTLMNSKDVKTALGSKYRTHKKRLKSMLEGCK